MTTSRLLATLCTLTLVCAIPTHANASPASTAPTAPAVAPTASTSAPGDASAANRANLTQALQAFLVQHGDICLAKYDWPIDVSTRDIENHTRDSIQLPVMAQQGLVIARPGYVMWKNEAGEEERVSTTRYELTELGRRYFKTDHEAVLHPSGGPATVKRGDFCAGHLDVDSIVKLSEPQVGPGQQRTATVEYHYRFTPEPWVRNEQIRAIFPMIDKIIKEQDSLLMTQSFQYDGQRWVAVTTLH